MNLVDRRPRSRAQERPHPHRWPIAKKGRGEGKEIVSFPTKFFFSLAGSILMLCANLSIIVKESNLRSKRPEKELEQSKRLSTTNP